jgi:hypothetical protein
MGKMYREFRDMSRSSGEVYFAKFEEERAMRKA